MEIIIDKDIKKDLREASISTNALAKMGIRRVFRIQQEKYFPLPDFDLATVYLIDRVQKHIGNLIKTYKEIIIN